MRRERGPEREGEERKLKKRNICSSAVNVAYNKYKMIMINKSKKEKQKNKVSFRQWLLCCDWKLQKQGPHSWDFRFWASLQCSLKASYIQSWGFWKVSGSRAQASAQNNPPPHWQLDSCETEKLGRGSWAPGSAPEGCILALAPFSPSVCFPAPMWSLYHCEAAALSQTCSDGANGLWPDR